MRILDKNTDFYDYLQNIYRDISITFDRTDSFVLTKELMCNYLQCGQSYRSRLDPTRWILLQVCNTFWLFVLDITEFNNWDQPVSYKIDLVSTWKNYSKLRCLIELSIIEFSWGVAYHIADPHNLFVAPNKNKIQKNVSKLVKAIDTNEYHVRYTFNKHTIRHDDGNHVEKHIPLLKACGIGNCIDPLDIFLAFEEYFSSNKQSQERTESVRLTDVEKIENHGFDKKSSFRGKK